MTVRANVCGRGVQVGDQRWRFNGCCLTAVKISARGKSKLIQFRPAPGKAGAAPISSSPSRVRS